MRVTILGSGASMGTPGIGIGWGRCDPKEPRNRRLRSSILVEDDGTRLLVDASPDLRQQLLAAEVDRLDALLLTHGHADHLHGIDELRAVNRMMEGPLDAYMDAATLAVTQRRFGYALAPLPAGSSFFFKPTLVAHEIASDARFQVGAIPITAFSQDHGRSTTLGFRFGVVAYSTDLVNLPEAGFQALAGIQVWIVGTLRDQPHETHAHVDKALSWIARVKPERAVLTHLGIDLDYRSLNARLPDGVEAAYDGLVIEAG